MEISCPIVRIGEACIPVLPALYEVQREQDVLLSLVQVVEHVQE